MPEIDPESSPARRTRTGAWRRYDEAAAGFRNYWYPIAWSRRLSNKPCAARLLNDDIVLIRDNGRVYALANRCPHRGVPLAGGRCEFPGTWSCPYHGWTFDLASGRLKAVLTDGPESPVCGRASVKTYPVEERIGLVWVYVGDDPPPPVERDIPEALLHPDAVILGRITEQKGNWRYGCENAFDEGHFKYLHRYGVLFSFFLEFPAWSTIKVIDEAGGWITRDVLTTEFEGNFGDLGPWPPKQFWKRRAMGYRLSMRLPCIMRNQHVGTKRTNFSWYVPVGTDRYRYVQLYTANVRGIAALKFRALFWTYLSWAHFKQFNNQDLRMVELMPETPPSPLYRPDASIIAWRTLCERAIEEASKPAPRPEGTRSAAPAEQDRREAPATLDY